MLYWTNTVLGLALIAAPFVLRFTDNVSAMVSSIILGAIVAGASAYKALIKDGKLWEDWVDVVAGLAAVLLPIVFGFAATTATFWTIVLLGVVVLGLSGYQIYETQLHPTK
jgi:hypothetical protein